MNQELFNVFNIACEKFATILKETITQNAIIIKSSLNSQTQYLRNIAENTQNCIKQLTQLKNLSKRQTNTMFSQNQIKQISSNNTQDVTNHISKIQQTKSLKLIQSQFQILNEIKTKINSNHIIRKKQDESDINSENIPEKFVIDDSKKINHKLNPDIKKNQNVFLIDQQIKQKKIIFSESVLSSKTNFQDGISNKKDHSYKIEDTTQVSDHYYKKISDISNRLQQIQKTQKIQFQFMKQNLKNQSQKYQQNNQENSIKVIQPIKIQKGIEKQEIQKIQQGNIDYKDRFLVLPQIKFVRFDQSLYPWVSDLYQRLAEDAFYGYFHKHLTENEMKMFFSQNIILNIVKMIKSISNKKEPTQIKQIFQKFKKHSYSALDYQLTKYPQKKKIYLKPQIENLVEMCNTAEDPQYDMLKNMNFHYEYDNKSNYYKQIKLMINNLIDLTNENFSSYKDEMTKIFQIIKEGQFQIGRKINQNVPKFGQNEIESNQIIIKSPQILRIFIKWIEELEDKIEKLDKHILNRYFPFPMKFGSDMQIDKLIRKQISDMFKKYLDNNKQHKFENSLVMLQNIEIEMINYINTNAKNFTHISKNNIDVGLATHLLAKTVSQIAIQHLNAIIHTILSFQKSLQSTNSFSNVSYITFSVSDLLRSKCAGKHQKIKKVYENLKQNPNFKIIRVKNRLQTGNRDFLVNMRYKDTPLICQLQLGLILEQRNHQKQDHLDHFNHFLYELRRSKYGPLAQAAILYAHFNDTINYFEDNVNKIRIKNERQGHPRLSGIQPILNENTVIIPLDQIQEKIIRYQVQEKKIIYVCHNCLQVKSTKTNFLNTYKKVIKSNQIQYLCGQCIINTLKPIDRYKYLLGDKISQFFEEIMMGDLQKVKLDELAYYMLIQNSKNREIVKKLDPKYFIQCIFSRSSLISPKFLEIKQLNIKYIYKIRKQMKLLNIFTMEQLNKIQFINQEKKEFLIKNQKNWKQVIYLENQNGDKLLIDATDRLDDQKLILFKKQTKMKELKISKVQYLEAQLWHLNQQFFENHLKDMKQITKLNIGGNNIKDISKIIKDMNLVELSLRNNLLQDIDLTSLRNLEVLDLSKNQLKTLTLTNEKCIKLNISYNKLTKIDITKMQKLKELKIFSNHFSELVLENKFLQKIDMACNNHFSKINIQKLVNLRELIMFQCKFTSIILNNPKLQFLDASQNEITVINLDALQGLKKLNLSQNQLTELQLDNPQLQTLDAVYNNINKFDISKLPKLKEFNLSYNKITEFSFKEASISLEKLTIMNNNLQKINLITLPNIKEINISKNKIDELIIGAGNTKLQKILANTNKIRKIDIKKLQQIKWIDFSKNQIEYIALENASLQVINLNFNRIREINIDKLHHLKQINIANNCITQLNITKENNSRLTHIVINNSQNYYQYILKILTEDEKIKYQQLKQNSEVSEQQILHKLKICPMLTNTAFDKFKDQLKKSYPDIYFQDLGTKN